MINLTEDLWNNNIPKVMVGVVTYNGKDYCKEEFMKRVSELTYESYTIEIVDTTDIKGNSRKKIYEGYELLREKFMTSDCDYLLTLEADIIPPRYIIEALMQHGKDVVGATYMIGQKKLRFPCISTGYMKRKINGKYEKQINFMRADELDGNLIICENCGLGCCLIKRSVFNKVKTFRLGDVHCDTLFHEDVKANGLVTWVDTGILCRHFGSYEEWATVVGKGDF